MFSDCCFLGIERNNNLAGSFCDKLWYPRYTQFYMWPFQHFLIKSNCGMPYSIVDDLKFLRFLLVDDNISDVDFEFVQVEL